MCFTYTLITTFGYTLSTNSDHLKGDTRVRVSVWYTTPEVAVYLPDGNRQNPYIEYKLGVTKVHII